MTRWLSQNKAGPLLGCAGPFVNQIIRGKRTPPLDRIDAWATALELDDATRASFRRLAAISHLPREVQAEFTELIEGNAKRIAILEQTFTELTATNNALRAELATLKAKQDRSRGRSTR